MLARVAERMYWMTRYLERAENTARLINATTQMLLDLPRGASFGWDVLLKVAGLDLVYRSFYPHPDEPGIMRFLIDDPRNPSSIVSCVKSARENSRTLREVLPRAAWERINGLYLFTVAKANDVLSSANRYNVLEELIERRQSVIGLLSENMSHDTAYQFIRLGRNIERADMTTRIIDITSAVLMPRQRAGDGPAMDLVWMGVLKSLNAYQMYRRHVSVHVRGAGVVDFMLNDRLFPHTVHYCLSEVERGLAALPNNETALTLLALARARIENTDVEALPEALRHEYLDAVQADLAGLDQELARLYFHRHDQPQSQTQSQSA